MSQRICSGFMSSRFEPREGLDDFPTPPWAGRALVEHVLQPFLHDHAGNVLRSQTVWEPAVNRGYLLRGLKDYFGRLYGSDVHDYRCGFPVVDFIIDAGPTDVDWIITNPPFIIAHAFIDRAINEARKGCAFLLRTSFLEGVNRYHALFSRRRPAFVAQFAERVPMVKGRVHADAVTMTAYCWIGWIGAPRQTQMMWIAPCRARLERRGDYDIPEVANALR